MPGRKLSEAARREDILRAAYDVATRSGVEALTLRAVAERATVSHGTVLFHFKRRDQLVSALLDRVLAATAILRIPDARDPGAPPADQLRALLRSEMQRLSGEARPFRLFLKYWALGVRNAAIRRRLTTALEAYRDGFRRLAVAATEHVGTAAHGTTQPDAGIETPDGVAAVAVSLVHGCALQAVIEPRGFDVVQHVETAERMLDALMSTTGAA